MEQNEAHDDEMPKLSLKQENEFKRMKLELESGAVFPDFKGSGLPAEVESLFLDNIFNFHNAYKNAKQISIYERIGSPDFEKTQDLSDKKITAALKKLVKTLNKNGIGFETIFTYDDRIIYEFITSELFDIEVDDIRMDNLVMHFVYEEFYPNHNEDIKKEAETFWTEFLDQDFNFVVEKSKIENKKELQLFRDSFAKFELLSAQATTIDFNLKKKVAIADVDLHFLGFLTGEKKPIVFQGTSTISFKLKRGYWKISEASIIKT